MDVYVIPGQLYLCLAPGEHEGKHFLVMDVSPEGDTALRVVRPGLYGRFGTHTEMDTELADPSRWRLVRDFDHDDPFAPLP